MNQKSPFPHVVIRASAGTGKTYQLAVRFIGLLAAGARPDEILATTFTRKAAGEILDRVMYRLALAAASNVESERLARAIGINSLTREKCQELLIAMVRRLHALRVGTLDSYFLQVAGSFGQELGLPPGWSICDELVDAVLRDEAIELVLARGRMSDLSTLVHSLTKGAAARSVARLARDTVSGLFELYRETPAEAWRQIAVCKGLEPGALEETLIAIASFELPVGQLTKTREKDLEKARLADWEGLISAGFASKVLSGDCIFNRKPLPPELVKHYQPLLKHVESILVGQVARQTEATHELLTKFAEHYRSLQLDEGSLRFSDVTFGLADAGAIVGPERMAFRLDGGIRHLLLDEFQDTSPSQWRVLRPLAENVTKGGGGTFFCVGDAKQAIYGWRGGLAEIFDALDGQLAGLTPSNLDESHRSAQPVIDAVNQVFQNLTNHSNLDKLADPVREWQKSFPAHTTARAQLAGHVRLTTCPEATGDQPQADVLFQHAAEQIRDFLAAAPKASVGVLVRTNAAVARLIYLLRSLGIEASEEGGNPLVDSPAVELLLSLLRLADHPADSVARFHLATSPLAASLSLGDYRNDAAATRLSQQVRRRLLEDGYGKTIFAFAQQLAPSCDARDLSRLQQLVELGYEYQPTSTLRTSDFIRLVETRKIADPQAADVRVMTVHQAKGLQFDVVFLPELEAKLIGQPDRFVAGRPAPTEPVNVVCRLANENVRQFFPPALQKLFEDDMCRAVSESLCVLYVAMTRAVHALHMIIAPAKPSEKSMPKTFAGVLRATLAAGQPAVAGARLYEHGDAKWYLSKKRKAEANRMGEGPAEALATRDVAARREPRSPIQLAASGERRQRGLERTSPSALEGGGVAGAGVLAARSAVAFGIGTLFHAWLAEIAWLDDGAPSDETLQRVAGRLRGVIGFSDDELAAHIDRFRKQLSAKAIADVLSRKFYDSPVTTGLAIKAWQAGNAEPSALRERAFAVRIDDKLVPGSIDRLVVIKSGGKPIAADVIDFKTDDLEVGDKKTLATKMEFYRPQMEAYRAAAAKLLSLDVAAVKAALVFLQVGGVERL